ncbi:ATP-binding protein [Streptomyces sp. NPDC008313]|uniref:ATP-binding protein n=1 Tax=Streptomyces sp. NPDC008313 TaxID=3364826 RepID=UPI0036E9D844
MADHLEASVTLPSAPASVSAARTYVTDVLAEWGLPSDAEAADTVRLIVSELATNAVQHTLGQSPTFTVDLLLDRDDRLRLGVTDSHPRLPKRLPAAVQQDNGRGLVIIRWLTAECGGRLTVRPTREGGKTIWVQLPWAAPVQQTAHATIAGQPIPVTASHPPPAGRPAPDAPRPVATGPQVTTASPQES